MLHFDFLTPKIRLLILSSTVHTKNHIYASDYPASEHMKFFCTVNVYMSSTVAACKLVKVSL